MVPIEEEVLSAIDKSNSTTAIQSRWYVARTPRSQATGHEPLVAWSGHPSTAVKVVPTTPDLVTVAIP